MERDVGRPQENSEKLSTVTLQPLVADHATVPHVIAMDLPFHSRYSRMFCYQKLQSDRLHTGQYWIWVETRVPQPLSLPTGCFSEFGRLSYLI